MCARTLIGMILDPSRHAFRVTPADELGLLIDADDYYREFYRAACRAEHTILLSGWQFDSDVALLRGPEAAQAGGPVTLLKFLNHLCEQKPGLKIWILAWDFSLVFAAEREWMQRVVFEWSSHENLNFRFDDNHVERGCHHQKFVVIDTELAFLGGLDLCDDRWDTREHNAHNDLRISRDAPHKPFHDIQLYLRGQHVAAALTDLFLARWVRAGGEPIALPPLDAPAPRVGVDGMLPLPAAEVALSRTDPYGTPGGPKLCTEILALHEAAIAQAERLIYLETQYFS
ncbi:MAG TPA: phospholipase, partial [Polyangiales bacterium]|nr:phospholipase [Polyangiales bacterium]